MPLLIKNLCVLACRVILAFRYRPKTQYLRVLCIIQSVIRGPNVRFLKNVFFSLSTAKLFCTNQSVM